MQAVCRLDLKQIAVGKQAVQPDRAQRLAPPGFEATRRVGIGHPGNRTDVNAGPFTKQEAVEIPIQYVDSVEVSGTQHQMMPLQQLQEVAKRSGIVREI